MIRSARKSIAEEVKRRLPRKPWMEVNCPAELRELVYRARKPRKSKEKTPTKSDHILSDGKTASPIKSEVVDGVASQVAMNDEKPALTQEGVPLKSISPEENIGIPTEKGGVTPVGQPAAGQVAGDLGTPGNIGGRRVDEPIVIDD